MDLLEQNQWLLRVPGFVPYAVDGQTNNLKWVLSDGSSGYMLDSSTERLHRQTAKLPGNSGSGFYAAQTYTEMPAGDARRVRIGGRKSPCPACPLTK